MKAPRTLTIVTAAPHYEWEGQLWSHAPYVREIDLWGHLFEHVIIVGPAERTRPTGDCIAFEADSIDLRRVPPTGGDDLGPKLRQLVLLPLLVWRVSRALRDGDAVHVRCPGNIGLLGVLLAPVLCRRMVAKYAGQWNGFPGEKWTVRLQRALLRSRWWRGPVTVYGSWPNQPRHVIDFFTSVLSDAQVSRARDARTRRRTAGSLRVIFVGRLSGPKNVDTVLQAVARVVRNGTDVHCTIVGDGAEGDRLRSLARGEGIEARVEFVGAVGIDDVLARYEAADTLVLVSQSEGWPKAIAEAMTFGLVCVGSDRGMVPQMLADGRGVVVPPQDEEALADALARIAADPEGSDAMGRRAAEWGGRHSLEELEAAIAALLTEWWDTPIGSTPRRASVLHVTDSLDAGGAERMAVNLVNALPRDRFRTALCTTRHDGALAAEARPDVRKLRLRRSSRLTDPLAVARLAAFLRRESIDIVHAHGTSLFISAAACTFARDTKLVWHDHLGANASSGAWRRRLYRVGASRADHVITVNHALESWAIAALHLPPSRVTTVPNFVLPSTHAPTHIELPGIAGKRIVAVANLRREKDHATLLDALARVVERVADAHALLVGAPAEPEVAREIDQQIAALGLAPHVTLLGTRSDVASVLRDCSVGVLSSRSEGFPLALLEYGSQGLAVVATEVGECAEIVDHGRAGRLVAAGDAEAMADALAGLLEDPVEAARLGQRLKDRVAEQYGPASVIRRIEHIYRLVMNMPSPPHQQ